MKKMVSSTNSVIFVSLLILYLHYGTAQVTFNIAVLYDGSSIDRNSLNISELNTTELQHSGLRVVFHYEEVSGDSLLEPVKKVCKFLQDGFTGFASFLSCLSVEYVDFYSNALTIPNVVFMKQTCDTIKSESTNVRLTPHCSVMNRAIANVVEFEKWSDIVLIYDKSQNSRCLHDLLVQVSKILTRSRLAYIQDDVTTSLETIKSLDGKHFIVMANYTTVDTIMLKAKELEMVGSEYYWTVVEMELNGPWTPNLNQQSVNMIQIRQRMGNGQMDSCKVNQQPIELLYLRDVQTLYIDVLTRVLKQHPDFKEKANSCSNLKAQKSEELKIIVNEMLKKKTPMSYSRDGVETVISLDKLQKFDHFREEYKLTIDLVHEITRNIIPREIDFIYSNTMWTKLVGLTGNISTDKDGYPLNTKYDICGLANKTNATLEKVATWDSSNSLQMLQDRLFLNKFNGFGNRTLIIATQEARPFTIKSVVNGTVSFTGFCINILDELASRFKFKYKLVEPPDGLWGGKNNDGTWNGMVSMVMKREVEFAIGPFTITSLREQVIDFTKPFMEDGAGIITKRPDGESDKMFQIFKPFDSPVWACIAGSIVVVGLLLFFVNRYSPFTAYNRHLKDASPDQISLSNSMWLIFGAFVEQGGVAFPTAISGRCILGFWWVFTILITSTYTANLAAYLTVTIAEKPINSLVELNGQKEIQPLVKVGTNLHSLFKRAESGIYQKIWDKMESDLPVVKSADEALTYVRRGDTAFMTDRTQLEYIVLNDCVTYALADEIFNTAGYGFVLPEGAPYMDIFNYNIMRMQEAGLIENWRQKWWPRSDSCSNSARTSSAQALGLDSLAGPFLVYVSVAGLSCVCLFFEILVKKCFCRKTDISKIPSKQKNGVSTGHVSTVNNNGFR